MENEVILLQRARDFSNKMNATFEFVKRNYKALGKSILFISGPPVLVGSVISSSFLSEFMSLSFMNNPDVGSYILTTGFWTKISMVFLFGVLGFVVNISTINTFIKLYDEKKSGSIEVSEVWEGVQKIFWKYLGSAFLFFILLIVAYIVLLMPIIVLAKVSGVLTFFLVVFVFCAMFYLIFASSLTLFIQSYEEIGFFEALTRSFKLVQGKWWSTFGLVMILTFIVGIASYFFMIPYYAVTIPAALHSVSTKPAESSSTLQILSVVFFSLNSIAQMLLYALPHVGISFQYFNLVELKESTGLMNEIQSFGTTPDPTGSRPEENY